MKRSIDEKLFVESDLYVHKLTLQCAVKNYCIPCFYKIFPNGSYKHDSKFIKLPPNQRPENCFRSKHRIFGGLYSAKKSLLSVGDGDFSFSLSLAQNFAALNKQVNFFATSHESFKSIVSSYPNGENNVNLLSNHGVIVLHDVDATRLSSCKAIEQKRFDVIIWNFPCIAIINGADGQANEIDLNKNLLAGFFSNAHNFLSLENDDETIDIDDNNIGDICKIEKCLKSCKIKKNCGEVHVTHKTIEPFSWWRIKNIAIENGFLFEASVVFDRFFYFFIFLFDNFLSYLCRNSYFFTANKY
jgi:25S rRNA (uracil2634-N3)-methyltransferase